MRVIRVQALGPPPHMFEVRRRIEPTPGLSWVSGGAPCAALSCVVCNVGEGLTKPQVRQMVQFLGVALYVGAWFSVDRLALGQRARPQGAQADLGYIMVEAWPSGV